MSYSPFEIAKIVAAWLGVGLAAGLLTGFLESPASGRRAAVMVWLLALPFPLWQLFPRRYAVWIGLAALSLDLAVWGWLRRRDR